MNRPIALLALSAVLAIASLPIDGPAGIALALAALVAVVLAYRTRHLWPMSPATRAARSELTAARAELARVSNRDGAVTGAYLTANRRVIDAEKLLSWWQRIDIELSA